MDKTKGVAITNKWECKRRRDNKHETHRLDLNKAEEKVYESKEGRPKGGNWPTLGKVAEEEKEEEVNGHIRRHMVMRR